MNIRQLLGLILAGLYLITSTNWTGGAIVGRSSLAAAGAASATASGALVNGDFEAGLDAPTGWKVTAWDSARAQNTWETVDAASRGKSVRLAAPTANDLAWIQTVAVAPNTPYRLSGWIKTENVAHTVDPVDAGASLSVHGTWTRSEGVFGTRDWTFVSLIFTSGGDGSVTVAARLGYWSGTTTGTAWFDDLQLEALGGADGDLVNAGLEPDSMEQAYGWSAEAVRGTASFGQERDGVYAGAGAASISLAGQGIARWTQAIPVEPDTEYELSGWIKTRDVQDPAAQWWTTGAKLGVYGLDSYLAAATPGLRGTHEWTHVSARFITGRTTAAKIACTLGEADPLYARPTSSGTMWCDDLALTKLRTLERTTVAGRHIILHVYKEDMQFADPQGYVARLDEVYEAMAELVGGVPFDGKPITIQSDASMYYSLLSGNPVRIGPNSSWAEIVNRNGIDFGVPHELGHNFDLTPRAELYSGKLPFANGEHWANFKVLYAFERLAERHPGLTVELSGQAIPIADLGGFFALQASDFLMSAMPSSTMQSMSNDTYTGLLYTLRQQSGWDSFRCTFRSYGDWTSLEPPPTDEAKVELWAKTLSTCAGADLTPAFRSWGFDIASTQPAPELTERFYLPLVAH